MQLGLYTFADVAPDSSPAQRLHELLEEAELAELVGLDVFGVGEHHRQEFAVSAPAVVLAAVAARTERIRLTSAVTVLSSDDPIRVFQQFATVDALANGRAEIMAGRGSFIESFPLFGYDLADYDRLFEEKLERLLAIRRASAEQGVFPPPVQQTLPVWVAVGGSPESAVRAGTLGLPMALAIIGGRPDRFVPFVELHREASHGEAALGINSPAYVADTSQQAADEFFSPYAAMMTRIGRERGWPPLQRPDFEALRSPHGALVLGSPAEVTEKILYEHELFGHDRFLAQIGIGALPHDRIMRAIELFGTEVAPAVRAEVARRAAVTISE